MAPGLSLCVGQVFALVIYSFLGAALLCFTESYEEDWNVRNLNEFKRSLIKYLIGNISKMANGNASSSADFVVVNESSPIWNYVDQMVTDFGRKKEALQPFSNRSGWSFWGSLVFCGTIYTTVG